MGCDFLHKYTQIHNKIVIIVLVKGSICKIQLHANKINIEERCKW